MNDKPGLHLFTFLARVASLIALAFGSLRPIVAQLPLTAITEPVSVAHIQLPTGLSGIPVMFIEDSFQTRAGTRFRVQGANSVIYLTEDAIWFSISGQPGEVALHGETTRSPQFPATRNGNQSSRGANLRLSFVDANPHSRLEPFDRLNTTVSYFHGSDPAAWQGNVPVWGGVRYVDLYPGIDLKIGGTDGELQFRLVTHSEENLDEVCARVEGADAVTVAGTGDYLQLTTAAGNFTLPLLTGGQSTFIQPTVQQVSGQTFDVTAPFMDASRSDTFGQTEDASSLLYSTFIDGDYGVIGHGIALDGSGAIYVSGSAFGPGFPVTPGAFDTSPNGVDAFVLKLNPAGTAIEYATFLGGSGAECNNFYGSCRLAVDNTGKAYVTGYTYSADFPTTVGAYDRTANGYMDSFVVKLNASGSALEYSTYLGGSVEDLAKSITVDSSGAAYVTGYTNSADFPTTPGAFDRTYGLVDGDAFAVKLDSTGTALIYSTFLGGGNYDEGTGITVDSSGAAYVTGGTYSDDFPVTPGAFDQTRNGRGDTFIAKLNQSGSALVYATFVGGGDDDYSFDITVDNSGAAYVTGYTYSADFPTTPDAFDQALSGYTDVFVCKLNATGSTLDYATFLGGGSAEGDSTVAVDAAGAAYVAGYTVSSDFPTTPGAFSRSLSDYTGDVFVSKLDPIGSTLYYSTLLGGSSSERVYDMAIDASGAAYITGYTTSADFPTTPDALDTTCNGCSGNHPVAFVAKIRAITADIDAWVKTSVVIGAPPGGIAIVPIQYGNIGLTTAMSVALTATLSSGLNYAGDDSGLIPTVDGGSIVWTLSDIPWDGSGQFAMLVDVPAATYGTFYSVTLDLSTAGPEANPFDNTVNAQIMIAHQMYLAIAKKNSH
jgi:hypothetical protein